MSAYALQIRFDESSKHQVGNDLDEIAKEITIREKTLYKWCPQ